MADVNTNTATQTQEQGNGTQTNTTANANTTGAGADNTPKVKTEEEIRAELQKEYEKMADKRVTDAIKKKEKEWADKQAKEKMTEDERRQAEEQERLQAQAKRDLDLTIKGLKLDVVDAVQEMGLDAGFRNLIAVEDLATIVDEDERKASGTKVQVMVEQPVFYVKAVPVSSKNATSGKGKQYTKGRFYISPTPKAGFTAPRAFYDNHGIVQDKIYLSAFEGCIYDTDAKKYLTADEQVADFATDMLSSIAGVKPASGLTQNLTRANVRKLCANRGAGWESHSIFAMAVTEWLLMIEYASLDAQRKVGRGVCDFTDDGKTNMSVNTGATSGLGNGSGIDPNGGVDGKCSVSYRGEENLWGNIWTWLDKVNILAKGQNEVFVHEIGATVADDTTTGYKSLGYHWSHSNGYQSAFGIDPEHPELLIPTEASGSDVFTGNYVWQNYTYNGFLIAILGGRWDSGSICGFYLNGNYASGYRYRAVGGRLLYVPQTKVA